MTRFDAAGTATAAAGIRISEFRAIPPGRATDAAA
ncbi:hypothetical protein J2X03_000236 [Microbacterium trichothecenolyticum]|nr:hypothetical protein [Microbacterium trichothecenolyticum]